MIIVAVVVATIVVVPVLLVLRIRLLLILVVTLISGSSFVILGCCVWSIALLVVVGLETIVAILIALA